MKKFRVFSAVALSILLVFVFAGCNNKSSDDATASSVPTTATEITEATVETSSERETTEAQAYSYTQDPDELEMMTQGSIDTPEPTAEVETTPQQKETSPAVQETTFERIELPFVPVN